jgi:hypothetical protein
MVKKSIKTNQRNTKPPCDQCKTRIKQHEGLTNYFQLFLEVQITNHCQHKVNLSLMLWINDD